MKHTTFSDEDLVFRLRCSPVYVDDITLQRVATRLEELSRMVNTPELHDFSKGVVLEALHQREKHGIDQDASKTPFDWVFLVGHLATRAATNFMAGNMDKALHHCITTAAALANWHAHITKKIAAGRDQP